MALSKVVSKNNDHLDSGYKSPVNMNCKYNSDGSKTSPNKYFASAAWCKSEAKNRDFFNAIREEMGEEIWTSGMELDNRF